jgi:heme oxygenase
MELHYLSRQERQFYGSLLASVNDRTHADWQTFSAMLTAIIMPPQRAEFAVGHTYCDGCPAW